MFQVGESAGKSGSFFFFSQDGNFIIKTISATEKDILLRILDNLVDHYQFTNPKSLLAKIYGMFNLRT
jgi:1-phosphatidylinositol-4-phosphate 5-kinase